MRPVVAWSAALGLIVVFGNPYPPADGTQARAHPVGTGSPGVSELGHGQAGLGLGDPGESPPHRASAVQPFMALDGDPGALTRALSYLRRLHHSGVG
jgi:hypothetical protein